MSETVGELINRAISDAAWGAGHDSMTPSAHAASSAWGRCMRVVRAAIPGLWDTEIVEATYGRGDYETYDAFFTDKLAALDYEALLGLKDGQRVRIIILPLEEKEDDSR